jgi:hypothetical protein
MQLGFACKYSSVACHKYASMQFRRQLASYYICMAYFSTIWYTLALLAACLLVQKLVYCMYYLSKG